jgi:hypothetical protein
MTTIMSFDAGVLFGLKTIKGSLALCTNVLTPPFSCHGGNDTYLRRASLRIHKEVSDVRDYSCDDNNASAVIHR